MMVLYLTIHCFLPFPFLGAVLGTSENCQVASSTLLLLFGTVQYIYSVGVQRRSYRMPSPVSFQVVTCVCLCALTREDKVWSQFLNLSELHFPTMKMEMIIIPDV